MQALSKWLRQCLHTCQSKNSADKLKRQRDLTEDLQQRLHTAVLKRKLGGLKHSVSSWESPGRHWGGDPWDGQSTCGHPCTCRGFAPGLTVSANCTCEHQALFFRDWKTRVLSPHHLHCRGGPGLWERHSLGCEMGKRLGKTCMHFKGVQKGSTIASFLEHVL